MSARYTGDSQHIIVQVRVRVRVRGYDHDIFAA